MRLRSVALMALLAGVMLAFAGGPSSAQDDPSPSPSATATEPIDGPSIVVVLIDRRGTARGEEGTPVPDVGVSVTSGDGQSVGEGITDAEGRVAVAIPGSDTYTVSIDADSLPSGTELSGEGGTERTINVFLDGETRVQFPIDDAPEAGPGFGERLTNGVVSGVKFGLIVALAALGLSMIFGTTGLTNFSHGDLITFGGLVTYGFNRGLGLPVLAAGLCAVVLAAVFGWAQDRVLWRPLRRRGTGLIAMMIVSIGLALFLRNLYQYFFGGATKSLTQYVDQSRTSYGPINLADKEIGIIVIALVAITVVCVALMTTRLGKATRAVSDNPALASSSGLHVDGVISAVWIGGTALTGLAGALLAVNQQVEYQMGFKMLLLVFAAVTLGGLGTIWGALAGSMVVGIMVEISPVLGVPSELKYVGALLVLILVLLVRPQGILGRRERIG